MSESGQDPESESNEAGKKIVSRWCRTWEIIYFSTKQNRKWCRNTKSKYLQSPAEMSHGSWSEERWHLSVWCVCVFVFKAIFYHFSPRQGLRSSSSACSGVKDPNETFCLISPVTASTPLRLPKTLFLFQWLHRQQLYLPCISSWNWNITRRPYGHLYFYLIAPRAQSSFQLLKPPLVSFLQ